MIRTRLNSNTPLHSVVIQTERFTPPGATTTATELNKKSSSDFNKMTDYVTPRFGELRNKGYIVNNNMTQIRHNVSAPRSAYLQDNKRYGLVGGVWTLNLSERLSSVGGGHSARNWLETQLVDPASTDLEAAIASKLAPGGSLSALQSSTLAAAHAAAGESKALALVTLAEAKKTLALAEDALVQVRTFQNLLKQQVKGGRGLLLTPRGLLAASGSAASAWLLYRYGIMPLFYEISAYADLIGGKKSKRVRFTSAQTVAASSSHNPAFANLTDYISEARPYYRSRRDKVSSGVLVSLGDDSRFSDLGLDRVLTTAWELVPFSFVIDWFANVSTMIAAHEGRFSQKILCSWTSISTEYTSLNQILSNGRTWNNATTRYVGQVQRSYTASETLTYRRRLANPPLGVLPQFDVKLNWKRFTDIAALVRTILVKV